MHERMSIEAPDRTSNCIGAMILLTEACSIIYVNAFLCNFISFFFLFLKKMVTYYLTGFFTCTFSCTKDPSIEQEFVIGSPAILVRGLLYLCHAW